ncbi:hypothetical protein BCV71DRAFT_229554 [Rhizopus microsporus]|uniref:Uncharacterized protein n=1 Tax=Rhizopus microsporus TaxID=58291 RepID=A0A1X0RPI9_RHIZD|nr:hypothetical protein BCV71DRAFT_229554 [Rhizopus microsporus]
MSFVMKNMLMKIVKKAAVKLDDIHIVGYNINSKEISLMNMDSPMEYVTRIRHLNKMSYPSSSDDYITCMIPLLQLAELGKVIMEDTLNIIHHIPRSFTISSHPSIRPVLPPCFLPSSSASSSSKKAKNQIQLALCMQISSHLLFCQYQFFDTQNMAIMG